MEKNYYEILEISPKASKETINVVYRSLSKKHHPDNPYGSTEKMSLINEAYAIISDDLKRSKYDARCKAEATKTAANERSAREEEARRAAYQREQQARNEAWQNEQKRKAEKQRKEAEENERIRKEERKIKKRLLILRRLRAILFIAAVIGIYICMLRWPLMVRIIAVLFGASLVCGCINVSPYKAGLHIDTRLVKAVLILVLCIGNYIYASKTTNEVPYLYMNKLSSFESQSEIFRNRNTLILDIGEEAVLPGETLWSGDGMYSENISVAKMEDCKVIGISEGVTHVLVESRGQIRVYKIVVTS